MSYARIPKLHPVRLCGISESDMFRIFILAIFVIVLQQLRSRNNLAAAGAGLWNTSSRSARRVSTPRNSRHLEMPVLLKRERKDRANLATRLSEEAFRNGPSDQ